MESAQKLEIKFGGKLREWEYFQLNHLINTAPHPFRDGERLNRLEKLCMTSTPLKGGISKVYEFLTDLEGQDRPPFIEKWEIELDTKLKDQQIKRMITGGYNQAWDINTIEMNYKFLVRYYMTPERLHKINQAETSMCWRNCRQKATMLHIWWDCPKISTYWQDIIISIKEITDETIENNRMICLFHDTNSSSKQHTEKIMSKLLNAAKGVIPKNWLKSEGPDLRDWIKQVEYYHKMELLCCKDKEQIEMCKSVWAGWERFKTSEKYWQKKLEGIKH